MKIKYFLGIGFTVIIFLGVCIMFLGHYVVVNSESYPIATTYLKKNTKIIEMTGGVESFGWFPSAEIVTHSWAEYDLSINGKKEDIWVNINLETNSIGEWEVISCKPHYKNTSKFSLKKLIRGN